MTSFESGASALILAHPALELPSWRETWIARKLAKAFATGVVGRLEVTFPSGMTLQYGAGDEHIARVALTSMRPVWRLLTRGGLGLSESYVRGELETPDLASTMRFFAANYSLLEGAGRGVFLPRKRDIAWHGRRRNTRRGSKRNIAAHYDLGNAFYALWLDPSMTYSSALFRDTGASLTAAQDEKYKSVLSALALAPGSRVLEIGCGWGGFAECAARAGHSVTALTLSREQLKYAQTRLADAALSSSTEFRFEDYRDCAGTFDAIASIEMIEAVGEENWPSYFQTIYDRLKPGGKAAIQAITIDERYFASYRRQADFIQRYIFPGGMLPTAERIAEEAGKAGLTCKTVERFGQSYARTLGLWRRDFEAQWDAIAPLGFDARFKRMWRYYLTYCEVGFARGDTDVGIYLIEKPV